MSGGISPDEINWHDGNLVDIRVSGLDGNSQRLDLTVDLYEGAPGDDVLARFVLSVERLDSFSLTGDCLRLAEHGKAGNISYAHYAIEGERAFLSLMLFGGALLISGQGIELKRKMA